MRTDAQTQRPTRRPSRWPDEAELYPLTVPRYPAPPNTDDVSTWRPKAVTS